MKSSDLEEAIEVGDWEAFEREAKAIVDCTPLNNHTELIADRFVVEETGASQMSSSSNVSSSTNEGGHLRNEKELLSQESSLIDSIDEDLTSSDEDEIDSTKFAAIEKMIDDDDVVGLINEVSLPFNMRPPK